MPFHCQKAMLQDLSIGLDEIFGFSNPHNPNIPTKVTTNGGQDSPLNGPGIPGADAPAGKSPMNTALAAMLSPTAKPDDKKPKAVPKANLPCEDGDFRVCIREKRGAPSMPDDIADASQSGGDAANALKKGIDAAREILIDPKNQKCLDLFKNLGIHELKSAAELVNRYETNGWIKGSDEHPGSKDGKPADVSFSSRDVGAVTTRGTYSFVNSRGIRVSAAGITINKNGFFFSPLHSSGKLISALPKSGFYGMDERQRRAAIIIHELLHTIGAILPDGPDLKDDGEQSRRNAVIVQDNCFK